MTLLAVTADTWIVTGLGFGIVLALLFCLVFILQGFGWTMQKIESPRKPKEPKKEQPSPVSQPTPENIIKDAKPAKDSQIPSDDIVAVAYALYLAQNKKHDIPTAMISLHKHETAWNEKSVGMNNVGF